MKKKSRILFMTLALITIVLMNINLVISSDDLVRDDLRLSALVNMAMADSESEPQCQNCVAGGPGTQSCTYTIGFVTWSVSCQSGHYACCKSTGASCCA